MSKGEGLEMEGVRLSTKLHAAVLIDNSRLHGS